MSEAWSDVQTVKYGQNTLRTSKVMDRRKVQHHILQRGGGGTISELCSSSINNECTLPFIPTSEQRGIADISKSAVRTTDDNVAPPARHSHIDETLEMIPTLDVEKNLLMVLCDASLNIPSHSKVIAEHTSRLMEQEIDLLLVEDLLRKYVGQKLLSIRFNEDVGGLFVSSLDFSKLSIYLQDLSRKWRCEREDEGKNKQSKTVSGSHSGDLEQQYMDNVKSQEGPILQGFCHYGSREECHRMGPEGASCKLQHFKKATQKHNSESVGDCSLQSTCFNMDSGKGSSNMAANTGDTTHQHMNTGPLLQAHVPGWYCDYEANSSLAAVYPGHRQEPLNRPYSSEPYEPTSIMDASHISGQSFPSHPSSRRMDPSRPSYLDNTGNIILVDLHRSSSMNTERNMPVRTFPTSRNPSSTPGGIPGSHTPGGSGNILNSLARPYIPATEAEAHIPQSSLLSEMPGTSSFSYPAIPYTLTLPPPAPAASAVAATPFTEVNDVPSFDMTGPIMSYPWSVTGDLFQTNTTSVETKTSSSKMVQSKSSNGGGKRRCRRPELWKKNVTKSKKLKGEEHVSRTGSVIPAKQVFEVDCSNCSFKCHENFTEDLRRQLFDVFYSLASNESQKQFVCQNVQESATKIANTNKKDGAAENKRKVCRKYFLPDTDNTRKQVCSKFFCRTLAIGKTFITHALRNKQFGCYVGKEKRGKPHNKIPDVQLEPARQHIISLLVDSSGSKRASKKKCVEQGLNITKMYEMYKQDCAAKNVSAISLSMYRRIFHTEF